MWRETDVAGVFLSPLVAYMAAALLAYLPLRWVLVRAGLLGRLWNPPLAETSLYLCILGVLVAVF